MPSRQRWVGCLVALLATVAVATGRSAFDQEFGAAPHFLLPFVLPILIAAWWGGGVPGLFATALNAIVIASLFEGTGRGLDTSDVADRLRVGILLGVGLIVSLLCENIYRYRQQVEAAAAQAARRQQELQAEINERRTAENRLRASERRYRALVQATPQVVWTAGGVNTEGAAWWLDLTGQSAEEAAEWGWLAAIHPADQERVRQVWTKAYTTHSLYDTEYRIRTRSGEYRHFAVRGVALTDAAGNFEEWVGTLTDVHDRTVAQEQLRELNVSLEGRVAERTAELRKSEERLRLATEAAGVGVWEWDILKNRIHWNDQMFRIYQVPPTPDGMVPYETWSGAVVPEELDGQEGLLWETVQHSGSGSRAFRIRLANGQYRHIESADKVRTNADGRVERVIGTNLDVTERQGVANALRESERKFRAVFHTQFQFIGLISLDGVLLEANQTALAGAGVTEKAVLGKPFWETVWWTHDAVQQDRLRDAIRRAADGQPAR